MNAHGSVQSFHLRRTKKPTERLNCESSMDKQENATPTKRPAYDCLKCPAYCCSYDRIIVETSDLRRLARHFDIDVETARRRFTKIKEGEQVLRHQKDHVYGTICMFIDTKTRRCTIYDARP